MRSIAKELGVCDKTIRQIVEDIHYRSYVLRKDQFPPDSTKKRRYEKAKLLLNRLKNLIWNDQLIFFSDKKVFSHYRKWWIVGTADGCVLTKVKFLSPTRLNYQAHCRVEVLGIVSNEGKIIEIMHPYFFSKDQSQLGSLHGDYVFQQDGAPAHTSIVTQASLWDNIPEFFEKELWPPNSSDCNPLDYFVEAFANDTSTNFLIHLWTHSDRRLSMWWEI